LDHLGVGKFNNESAFRQANEITSEAQSATNVW
jgi:hypothetical protein